MLAGLCLIAVASAEVERELERLSESNMLGFVDERLVDARYVAGMFSVPKTSGRSRSPLCRVRVPRWLLLRGRFPTQGA